MRAMLHQNWHEIHFLRYAPPALLTTRLLNENGCRVKRISSTADVFNIRAKGPSHRGPCCEVGKRRGAKSSVSSRRLNQRLFEDIVPGRSDTSPVVPEHNPSRWDRIPRRPFDRIPAGQRP